MPGGKNFVDIICGAPGTGKTTLINEIAKKYLEQNKGKGIVYFDPQGNSGLQVPHRYNSKLLSAETLAANCSHNAGGTILNSLIILDDTRNYLDGRKDEKTIQRMLINKRHSGNDYILVFHSLSDIPKPIILATNYLYAFRSNDTVAGTKWNFDGYLTKEQVEAITRQDLYVYKKIKIMPM
jgi:ABC-type molybdenum transport system ATPase subunit/photorepair protein PhrA